MRITKRELNNKYYYIIRAGYCEFQTLCRCAGVRDIGYACGVYGWNWTAYEFRTKDDTPVIVCTGYRDMTGERVKGLEKYEQKAKAIANDWSIDYKTKVKKEKANAKAFANAIYKKLTSDD